MSLVNRLDQPLKARLVENGERLARGWLQAVPSYPLLRMSDEEVAYAVRRTVLFDPCAQGRWGAPTCRCGVSGVGLHHLVCGLLHANRTRRHTSIVETLARELRGVSDDVRKEHTFGGLRHDVYYVRYEDGGLQTYMLDVSVVTTDYAGLGRVWPTPTEVGEKIKTDYAARVLRCARQGASPPRRPHPDVEFARAMRSLARERTCGVAIRERERRKAEGFAAAFNAPVCEDGSKPPVFKPFVLTAGGGVSKEAAGVLKLLRGAGDIKEGQAVAALFSMILVKAAARMGARAGRT